MKIRYITAVLALVSFSAHAGANLNALQLNGLKLQNGLMLQNGLGINGLHLNRATSASAPTNALVDLGNRPLVVQD